MKRRRRFSSGCAILLACVAARGAEAGFVLTRDGQPVAAIVTGAEPPETVAFAARELQVFVEKMSGARLAVLDRTPGDGPAVRLGQAALEVLGPAALEGVARDGYRIQRHRDDLCIVGIDDRGPHTDIDALLARGITHDTAAWTFHRGTLYGVYRLLEALGMRWFMPGPLGERVPERPTLVFRGKFLENPHFLTRTVSYWSLGRAGVQFRKDWEERVTIMPGEKAAIGFSAVDNRLWELRMRGESLRLPLNHNPPRARWRDRFAESHPEYFALTPEGTRDTDHLCYTDPGVLAEYILDARAFAEHRDAGERGIAGDFPHNRNWHTEIALEGHYSLLPSDGFRQCHCDACRERVLGDVRETGQRHSRLVWDFVAGVARAVPELRFTCLAYGSYAAPYPGMQKLPSNVVVGFCAYSNPAFLYAGDNFQRLESLLERWAGLTDGNLAYWQHYLASNRGEQTLGMPEHIPGMYARTLRTLARYGTHAFCEMSADSILFELFNRYLLLKLFYDPTLDERALFEDFVMTFYGPAAGPPIAEIYADIEAKSILRFRDERSTYSVWARLYDEATMRGYHERADHAAALAAGTPYAAAVAAFRDFYLGLMERGRRRFADPLAQLLASFNPELVCRRAPQPPPLDGAADAPAWRQAESIAFGSTVNGRATRQRTTVRGLYDDTHLYLQVRAAQPGAKGLPAAASAERVTLYLDAPRTYKGYYRIAVDLAGALDEDHTIDDILRTDRDWRSGAQAVVRRDAEGYVVGLAVPWATMHLTGEAAAAAQLGVLLARTQADPPSPEDRQSTTSIILRGDPEQPGAFNTLRLKAR